MNCDLTTWANIPDPARNQIEHWKEILAPVLQCNQGIVAELKSIATRTGHPFSTVRTKYYALRHKGPAALADGRTAKPKDQRIIISRQDIETLRTYIENNQRKNAPAIRAMRRDWLQGKITTATPIDPATGFPRGWSPRNLNRFAPDRFTLTAARIGRTAAATERRLVYTTRRNLYVGSHYLFDDMWHDHMVNVLDQQRTGRPLEFHVLDLYSACKFAWGMTVRLEKDGRMKSLTEADMRFTLANVLGGHGYSPRGTVLVVEHGTAAIRPDLEAFLYDTTGGLVTIARSGMEGASAAAHQYAGRSKGNFRFKAALESLGNPIHNEMAALPGQTGLDIDHRPEQLHGLLRRNDALMAAVAQLPPERAAMLRWPLLTIQQFRVIADEIYTRINARTEHDLEGWDQLYIPDTRTMRMRRLAPAEVWNTGKRDLIRLNPEAIAGILVQDNGVELTTRGGMLTLRNGEVTGDVLRYDAHMLPDREKFLCILNPYNPDVLYIFDSRRRFLAAAPRIHSVCKTDIQALQRQCGAAAKVEADRLAPFRRRHAAEARQRAADMRHNARILSGDAPTPSRLPDDEALAALSTSSGPTSPDETESLAECLRELT